MENLKPNYYIFCGIDGVLWDIESGYTIHGPYLDAIENPVLKKESVQALNLLLKSLEQTFDTKLVITSPRRRNLADCATYLSANHLEYDKPLFATKYVEGPRGEKILGFMEDENNAPKRVLSLGERLFEMVGKKTENGNFSNYVVLEDNKKCIKNQIPAERTIKTNMKKSALSIRDVISYLSQNGLSIDEEYLNKIMPKREISFE